MMSEIITYTESVKVDKIKQFLSEFKDKDEITSILTK